MIDVYAPDGTYTRERGAAILQRLAECFLKWTDASDIPIARENTAAFLHALPPEWVTAGGRPGTVVRVDVKVPEVVLSTIERRRGFIADATEIVRSLAAEGRDSVRPLVTISNTVDAGWGIDGHGLTNAELDDF